ncbi:hypothetical protein ACOME3_001090 [Neoechinorhynchus agilis]
MFLHHSSSTAFNTMSLGYDMSNLTIENGDQNSINAIETPIEEASKPNNGSNPLETMHRQIKRMVAITVFTTAPPIARFLTVLKARIVHDKQQVTTILEMKTMK